MKHGSVFDIPFTERKTAYGRYSQLEMVQVFALFRDSSFTSSIDLEKLKQSNTLFSEPLGFRRVQWKKIGLLEGMEEPIHRFCMASLKVKIARKIAENMRADAVSKALKGRISIDSLKGSLSAASTLETGVKPVVEGLGALASDIIQDGSGPDTVTVDSE